jgi:fused signal recognition particle receptor
MIKSFHGFVSVLQKVLAVGSPEELGLIWLIATLYCVVALLSIRARNNRAEVESRLVYLEGQISVLALEIEALEAKLARATAERARPAQAAEVVEEISRVEAKPLPAPEQPKLVAPTPVEEQKGEIIVEEASTISRGMAKSRTSFLGKLKSLFTGRSSVDLSSLEDLEEMLITSDVGARVADSLVSSVREHAKETKEVSESALKDLLKAGIRKELLNVPSDHRLYTPVGSPLVILVVGVNGVGKTTTVAKLATRYRAQGKKVLAIAADTFRAAAVLQLQEWGKRSDFEVFSGADEAKPAAVVFDGMVAAKERGVDVVLIDTAGRLHTKSNLMQELEGVRNSIRRHVPDAPHETVLVVDGVSGQNALSQAREFNASTPLTGLVVTKLDGTPKGGIIVAISQELKIPVFYVGVGEKAKDLLPFSVDEFVEGLLSDESGSAANVEIPRAGNSL